MSLVNCSIGILSVWRKKKKNITRCCNLSLNAEILSVLSIVFDYGFSQYENTHEIFGVWVVFLGCFGACLVFWGLCFFFLFFVCLFVFNVDNKNNFPWKHRRYLDLWIGRSYRKLSEIKKLQTNWALTQSMDIPVNVLMSQELQILLDKQRKVLHQFCL